MDQLKDLFAAQMERNSKTIKTIRAMMGKLDGTLVVTGEPYTIWVTSQEWGAFKVLCRRVPRRWGKMVNLGFDPNDMPTRLQVLGQADVYDDATWAGPAVADHQETHQFGASDCDWIQRERMLYVVPVPGANSIKIYPDAKIKPDGSWWWNTAATTADFSASIPAAGCVICIVVLTAAGTVAFRTGTSAATRALLTAANFPTLTTGDSAFCGMILTAGMVQANHTPGNDDFIDLSVSGALGGAGQVVFYKQTEIDFGATGVLEKDFTITDADCHAGAIITAQVAYIAPTGKSLDELEFDSFDFRAYAAAGEVHLHARALEGSVAGAFIVNYTFNKT